MHGKTATDNLEAAIASGELKSIAQALKKLVAKTPNDAVAHYNLGVTLGRLGSQVEAVRHLNRASQLAPSAAEPHLSLGNLAAQSGNYDAAVRSFERAKTLNPKMLEAPNNLANLQMRMGDFASAIKNFALAVAISPTNTTVRFNQAFSLERCGELDAAIDGYNAVLVHDPNHTEALAQLSITLAERSGGDLEPTKILKHVERAVELEPHNIKYWAQYAAVGKRLGKKELVSEALNRVVQLTPQTKDESSIIAWAHVMNNKPNAAFDIEQDLYNILPLDELTRIHGMAGHGPAMLPTWAGQFPENSSQPVILTAASGDYAELYADKFVGSALSASQNCNIHLHLMNPGQYQAREALAKFPADRVTWSSEDIAPGSPRSIYASRRFVCLPELLERTKNVVVCLDVDSLINADIAAPMAAMAPFDVLVYERPNEVYLHQMLAAGFLAVSPTKNGMEFAKLAASYILHFENAGTSRWFVDQLAIVAAKAWITANNKHAVVKYAPSAMMDWSINPNPAGVVWTAKGKMKNFVKW